MNRDTIINILSSKLKLIRTEYNFSQDKMANILGISKKTLVQIEKERNLLNWTTAVALCAIFNRSDIIQMSLGDNPVEIIEALSLGNLDTPRNKTLGGNVWWNTIESNKNFKIQQNKLSSHYRILDNNNKRWYSSFDTDFIYEKFNQLTNESLE